jgi:hypothetical protein
MLCSGTNGTDATGLCKAKLNAHLEGLRVSSTVVRLQLGRVAALVQLQTSGAVPARLPSTAAVR